MNLSTLQRIKEKSFMEDYFFSFRSRTVWMDVAFLSLIMLFSIILYIDKIGFYSDDWIYLAYYKTVAKQSLKGFYDVLIVSPNITSRPVQAFLQALSYWLFGMEPLGHHLMNSGIILTGVLIFYFILRKLQIGRTVALSIAAIFILLPHYSTDRLWFSAFMVSLSMTLYFISLYADLQVLQSKSIRIYFWKALSIFGLVCSSLSYEVFMPLFFINPFLVWLSAYQLKNSEKGQVASTKKWSLLFLLNLLAMFMVVVYKVTTASRMGIHGGLFAHIKWFAKLIAKAVMVSYGEYGIALPRVVATSVSKYPSTPILLMSMVVGLLIFGYIYQAIRKIEKYKESTLPFLIVLCAGFLVFGAGYGIFLSNQNASITPTGIGNRIVLAASVGVAISFVGMIGWLSTFLSSAKLFRIVYSMLIALLGTGSFIASNTIASFWVDSTRKQEQIIADISKQFPTLPDGSTLILDGICPYSGPAVVYESSWDLCGSLMILYNKFDLNANIVTPNLKVRKDGLNAYLYAGANFTHHPYNDKMFIYHIGRKSIHYIPDSLAAQKYFQEFNPTFNNDCPTGAEGMGVEIF
ncbi:hypothetical protein GXP67_27430 [Rhodocytophaga rosea]|uniref:Glycosyltransferase RgtA/B/C/D-like domain-containing protein n=1 Tax=Rhodocytophaga rosea TaxID=2704465 RepID=A0A6C0GRD4_9BACT|nr:hypothetical protein [Rhodocytophaga rosea]QHT70112.1 hypothetical protein GXP67_27430 [Rhodocytophaga rosea]